MSPAGGGSPQGGRWRLIATLALVGALGGFIWGSGDRPLYEATAIVLAEGNPAEDPAALARIAASGTSDETATLAAGLLGDDVAGADLLSDVTIEPGADGVSIAVVATSELPDFAAATANGFAEALVLTADDEAKDGEGPLSAGAPAEIPGSPSENRSAPLWALIGLGAGLLVGLLTLIPGRLSRGRPAERTEPAEDTGYHDEEAEPEMAAADPLEAAFGVPLLSILLDPESALDSAGTGAVRVDREAAEAFRALAADLGLDSAEGARTIAVLDASARRGADAVSRGIAVAAAELGLRVVVVEADFDEPSLAGSFQVDGSPGLRDYLGGEASPREVLRRVRAEVEDGEEALSLVCVPAGEGTERGTTTIAGPRFGALIERLPRVYDLVVVEAPPLLSKEDAAIVARSVDAVVLVAVDDEESRSAIERSVRILEGAPLVGGILTGAGAMDRKPA